MLLSEATAHRRNGRGAWEEKNDMVFLVLMVLF
jgi:hypothetical protein